MWLFVWGLAVGLAGAAGAQEAPAPPTCDAPAYRQFDFWLGDWTVRDPEGAFMGRNEITRDDAGCLIVERWTSARGDSGQSYNYYDPAADRWRQVWVSQAIIVEIAGGLTEDGEMRLEGEITYRGGQVRPFKGAWTPLEDGAVRQHFEQYDRETDVWNAWFTGIYRPVDADPPE